MSKKLTDRQRNAGVVTDGLRDGDPNEVLSPDQAAAEAVVTRQSIYNWMRRPTNPLKAAKPGRDWQIKRGDLLEFVQGGRGRVGAAAGAEDNSRPEAAARAEAGVTSPAGRTDATGGTHADGERAGEGATQTVASADGAASADGVAAPARPLQITVRRGRIILSSAPKEETPRERRRGRFDLLAAVRGLAGGRGRRLW